MLKVLKKLMNVIFYVIIILIFILVLVVFSYMLYFQSTTTKTITGIEGMEDVRIEFDRVDTDIFKAYPFGNFDLKNFKLIDASNPENEKLIIAVNELSLAIENAPWEDKRLTIRDIKLDGGEIRIHRDSLGHLNLNKIFNSIESSSTNSASKKWSFDTDSLEFDLKDMLLSYTADDKYKSIITSVNRGRISTYQKEDRSTNINTFLDLTVIDFTLKKENGSFLENANIKGPIDLRIDQDGLIINQSKLIINNQEILASAILYNDKEKYSRLHFINNNTDFEVIKPLLSPKLHTTLLPYKAEGTFIADATLTLMPDQPLRVDVDFVFPGNDIHIKNQVFYKTKMSGHFVNDNIYDRTFNKVITDNTFIRFDIEAAETTAKGANVQLNNAIFLAGKGHLATITSNAFINGPTALISNELKNDKFLFNGGTFNIEAKLKGQLDNFQNMIEESDLSLAITNCNVKYLPSEVVLPLQTLRLNKKSGNAEFNVIGLTDDQEYSLLLNGSVTNLMDVINGSKNLQSITTANLKAKRLSWQDFIHILGDGVFDKSNKTPYEKRRDMKKTLKGLQDHFQPNIFFEIDSSGYYDNVSMKNIVARMHFPKQDVLAIDSASFNLEQGRFDFSAKYDISSDKVTPFEIYCNAVDINLSKLLPSFDFLGIDALRRLDFLPKDFDIKIRLSGVINDITGIVNKSLEGDIVFNSTKRRVEYAHINFDRISRYDSLENKTVNDLVTTMEIKGNPLVFNSYLNNDQFFFNEGNFELNVNYTGEKISLDNIISDGELTLSLDSSFVFYEPLSVTFPLTNIGLSVKKNIANYSILMRSDTLNQQIKLEGEVQNFSQIIVEDTGEPVRTTSNIYSPRITWDNFIDIFNIGPSDLVIPLDTVESLPKTATAKICELLYKFSPDIKMRFDTLEYSNDFSIHGFSAGLLLEDSIFYISDAKFDYRDSEILLNSVFHISNDIDSIDTKLNAKTIDIKNFIIDAEELTNKDYASINYLSGSVDFEANISQVYKRNDQLNDTIINGDVNFTINDLIIDEAPWMKKMGKKLWHPKRFKTLKFAPISNHLTFINDSLYIPLMELQSNAFNIFVDGYYYPEYPNIWLSIPLFNLKKRDLSIIPVKEGYARRKTKFHMEYGQHKKPKPSFKLRLSKRKFYKDRGLLDKWKNRRRNEIEN